QNQVRTANCRMRGSPAVVMRPKLPDVSVLFGRPKLARFSALNASARNCTRYRSLNTNVLNRPTSSTAYPGPRYALRADVPNVPSAFGANASVLNQRLSLSSVDLLSGRSGSPTRSARWLVLPTRALSTPLPTENPRPLCSVRIPVTDQLLNAAFSAALSKRPGSS